MSPDSGESSDEDSGPGDGAYEVFDLLPSMIAVISSGDDPSAQITSLTSFCEAIAFVEYDEDLDNLPLDEIVPLVVKLMQGGGTPDVMLHSARVLNYFVDRIPRSAKVLVNHGAIEALCWPLMEIEYLDVAEECMDALEKLSKRQPEECLKAGAIKAVLSFFDFFQISQQKSAVSTVINVCQKIPDDCISNVMSAIPNLCNLLDYQDRQLVESSAKCLMMIVENFSHSSELLEDLCKQGLVEKTLKLISPYSPMTLSEMTYIGMIGLLVQLASRSLLAVRSLYDLNINNILGSILKTTELSRCTPLSHGKDRSTEQIHVALKLISQLIPHVSREGQDTQLLLGKEKIIIDEHKLSLQFATDILPALMEVVNCGGNTCISYGCVSVVRKYVSLVNPEMMRALASNSNMPKFLAGLLSQKDHHLLFPALSTIDIIMKTLPGEFLNSFIKEGVIHAIISLSKQEYCLRSHDTEKQYDIQTSADLSRCVCYAFDPCSRPLSESNTCMFQRHTLPSIAQHIISTFFTDSVISITLSENVRELKAHCLMLDNNVDSFLTNKAEKESLSQILDGVVMVLNEGESMSTFEFIESGFMRSLVHYLTNGNYIRNGVDGNRNSDMYHVILKRLQTVTSLLFSGQRWQNFPLISLVGHLQTALSTLECLPVVLSSTRVPASRRADIPHKNDTTNPCLQVHLVREEEETDLYDYNSVVTVEFSSSLDSIEEFLWPKVNKKAATAKKTRANKRIIKQSSKGVDSKERAEKFPSQSNEGDVRPKLIFLLDGKPLDRYFTLYQAILQSKVSEYPDIIIAKKFWNEVHRVTFRRAKVPQLSSQKYVDNSQSFFSGLLLSELPCELEISNQCYDVMFTLKVLEGLNRYSFQLCSHEGSNAFAEGRLEDVNELKVIAPSLPHTKFINSKLTAKLEQQMHDRLALCKTTMPLWCTQLVVACPFLFSFESRLKYFNLNMFGMSRNQVQSSGKDDISTEDDRRSLTASLPRKKFRVHRNNILGSAAKMMSWYASRKVLLETVFSNEVGSGIGPTMEFYTLASLEFQKFGMGMWREDQTSKLPLKTRMRFSYSNLVTAFTGMFPRPWADGIDSSNGISFSKVLKNFFLLGQIMARAIRDGRILDLPFSRAFYKLILDQDLDIYDIQSFDPELGRTLIEFQALARRKRYSESNTKVFSNNTVNLCFRKTVIEDLFLDFALPGYPDYVFSSGCGETMVNTSNLEEYVSFVVDATVRTGISRQFESFKSGFNKVFPIKSLQIFTAEEVEQMLCGEQEAWNQNELQDHINFDHGYSSTSPPVIKFLEIIQEFDTRQCRDFLQFVTGAPRLARGGLAALKPKLTIVRKHCNNDVDMELPSVMTCANYLKLPPYSSKERMREKLLYAIMEGQGAFHLS